MSRSRILLFSSSFLKCSLLREHILCIYYSSTSAFSASGLTCPPHKTRTWTVFAKCLFCDTDQQNAFPSVTQMSTHCSLLLIVQTRGCDERRIESWSLQRCLSSECHYEEAAQRRGHRGQLGLEGQGCAREGRWTGKLLQVQLVPHGDLPAGVFEHLLPVAALRA